MVAFETRLHLLEEPRSVLDAGMHDFGRILVFIGLAIAAVGAVLWKTGGLFGLGKLPGDIFVQKGGSSFYFPIVTCIIISVILTLLSWLFRR
jgi:hypothetical protein